MANELDQLFAAYERGAVTRRDLLSAIAAFLGLGGAELSAQAPPPRGGGIHLNHVNLRVANVQRSADFYQKFFGFTMTPSQTYHALDCAGGTFLSLQTKADVDREQFRLKPGSVTWARTPTYPNGTLEHFCVAIDNVDVPRTQEALKAAGHEAFIEGANLFTSDPDGILVQVVGGTQRFPHEQR